MKKYVPIIGLMLLLPMQFVFAQPDYTKTLDKTGKATYSSPDSADFFETLGIVFNIVLSVLGIVLLVIIIYAGFLWMTAGGKPDQVTKAKTMLANSIIGLVLIVASYAISQFVLDALAPLAA